MNIIIKSLSIIAFVGVVATFVMTNAYLSDTETSTGNTFIAGELNLMVGDVDPIAWNFDVEFIKPGDSGSEGVGISNTGGVDGYLSISFVNIANKDKSCSESEGETDGTCGLGKVGELAENLDIIAYLDENNDGYDNGTDVLIYQGNAFDIAGDNRLLNYPLVTSNSTDFGIDWSVDGSVGNEIQTDLAGFDIEFILTQEEIAQCDLQVGISETYTTIQSAISAAIAGDTICVEAGTYGGNISLNKGVTLLGPNHDMNPAGSIDRGGEAVITGQVEITGNGAMINGFKLSGSRAWINGASDTTISYNVVLNSPYHGINIDSSSANAQVLYNTVVDPEWEGIVNWGNSGVKISHNYVTGVDEQQPIESTSHTGTNVEITYNTISDCTGAKGINYWGAPGAVISYNKISGTTHEAIFSDTKTNTIVGNTISNTGGPGIQIYNIAVASASEKSVIDGNMISFAGYQGIVAHGQAYTEIKNNILTDCNYAGADGTGDWDYAGIHVQDLSGVSGEYCSITNNRVKDGINGIQVWSDNCTIANNTITNMGVTYADTKTESYATYYNSAILIGGNFGPNELIDPTGTVIENNNIYNNYWGLFHSTDLTEGVTAEDNWWGDASGPTHSSNIGGIGDPVSDNVDFDPWSVLQN